MPKTIQQVLDGNTAMFELLMRRYNERVYGRQQRDAENENRGCLELVTI